jgi:Zn-dependent M28 family amino/carboxypeptidase
VVRDQAFREFAGRLSAGETGAKLSARFPASDVKRVTLRNVAGLLRGSDPKLKNTYVIVSGHYDHMGIEGGQLYNGANDDASGTSCMLALAEALSRLPDRPKRSILFIAYFGEEKGLLGSRYYGSHPLFPLAQTVANLNLEQMGRTDDSEGPQIKRVCVTGFDYSNLTGWLVDAGRDTGITFYKHETNSDAFFGRSDNQSLADSGVPAHTLAVSFVFPDYHQPGDHWEKIDYDNMAAVTRAIGVAVVRLANSPKPVGWNADNPKAASYVKAAGALARAH